MFSRSWNHVLVQAVTSFLRPLSFEIVRSGDEDENIYRANFGILFRPTVSTSKAVPVILARYRYFTVTTAVSGRRVKIAAIESHDSRRDGHRARCPYRTTMPYVTCGIWLVSSRSELPRAIATIAKMRMYRKKKQEIPTHDEWYPFFSRVAPNT